METTLYQGDCLEKMKEIADGSVDMVLADLPYGTTSCAWDSVIPVNPLWEQYKRIIKRGGTIALFGSEPFSTTLRAAALDWFKYDWIWEKEQSSSGLTAQTQPLKKHEVISVFYQTRSGLDTTNMFDGLKDYMISERQKCGLSSEEIHTLLGSYMASHYFTRKTQFAISTRTAYEKLQSTGYFQRPYEEIEKEYRTELDAAENPRINTYNPQMTEGKPYKGHYAPGAQVHGGREHFVKDNHGARFPTSIIKFDRARGLHPTQKPVPLLEYLIRTYTNPGETVLDNVMGSGSTGVAAINTGRNFIGIELDPGYFKIAQERIQAAQEAAKCT